LGLDRSFEKIFQRPGVAFPIFKEIKNLSSSLLGRVMQNTFTTGTRPFRIMPKPTLFSGIATRIVCEGQRIAFVAQ
jgi:hypothetical protein